MNLLFLLLVYGDLYVLGEEVEIRSISPESIVISADGKLILDEGYYLRFIDGRGETIARSSTQDGFFIGNFMPIFGRYILVSTHKPNEKNELDIRTFIYETGGEYKGEVFNQNNQTVYYRQAMECPLHSKCFIGGVWERGQKGKSDRFTLQEYMLEDEGDYFRASPRDDPFFVRTINSREELYSTFQRHYVSYEDSEEELFVVSEIDRVLYVFERAEKRFIETRKVSLSFDSYFPPLFFRKDSFEHVKEQDKYLAWKYSFTRICGVTSVGKDTICLFYQQPNSDHPWNKGEDQSSPTFFLKAEIFSFDNGACQSQGIVDQFPESNFLGMFNSRAWVFSRETKSVFSIPESLTR